MKRLGLTIGSLSFLGLLLMMACGESNDNEAVRDMPVSGGLFNFSQHSRYVALAEKRWELSDWQGTKHFVAKAKAAALGKIVLPDQPDEKEVPRHLRETFREAHQDLIELLDDRTKLYNPIDAAEAQVSFDCWLRQAEAEDAQTCRESFEEAVEHFNSHLKVVTVVLLPNLDGTVGSIEVASEQGRRLLSRAREATQLSAAEPIPSPPFILGQDEIKSIFGRSMEAQPKPPAKFLLYFDQDKIELADEPRSLLSAILREITSRGVVEVSVVGHTDRVSSDDYNRELSLKRARQVARTLIINGVDAGIIHVTSHGERNPLITTPDGVAEPRNRRVEVTVR